MQGKRTGKKAWDLAKSVHDLPQSAYNTFFRTATPSTIHHASSKKIDKKEEAKEECHSNVSRFEATRTFIVDSGASFHMISWNMLSNQENGQV